MPDDAPLDHLGRFLVCNARDAALESHAAIESGAAKAPALAPLVEGIARLTDDQRALVRRCVAHAVDAGIHDLLYALVQEHDFDARVRLLVDEQDATTVSDGLHGEAYGDAGWIARYSAFDMEGTRRSQEP